MWQCEIETIIFNKAFFRGSHFQFVTPQLIKYSEYVLHIIASTIQFAVLWTKMYVPVYHSMML
jgi:hypothetical protein